jgi:acid stress-induced BolA-like protein IbaG/YrbA
MRDSKALKLKKTQSVHSRFKAHFEDGFIRALSFEIIVRVAWTRIDR